MAAVAITEVSVLDNPSPCCNPIQFEIVYECAQELQQDLEWKVTYVGSATDNSRDQVLECVLVGPVQPGTFRFVLQANPPDWSLIPPDDVLGVTVVLLTCSYGDQEFVRVGYYVNNEYADPGLAENPPSSLRIEHVCRSILADQPRVTRFPIDFDGNSTMALSGDEAAGFAGEEAAGYGGCGEEMEQEHAAPPITPLEHAPDAYWGYGARAAGAQDVSPMPLMVAP